MLRVDLKKKFPECPLWLSGLRTQLVSMNIQVRSLALLNGLKDPVLPQAVVVVCRCGLDPMLLWLWCSLAAAALIRPLAWELPQATGGALKWKKKKKKEVGVGITEIAEGYVAVSGEPFQGPFQGSILLYKAHDRHVTFLGVDVNKQDFR